ncbi:MAG: hypothetical protein Q7S92_00195 [Candidatus Diapherotrites archaeon]|nr:hypothetical protein [Candidatus Diapherotrites archaeon]
MPKSSWIRKLRQGTKTTFGRRIDRIRKMLPVEEQPKTKVTLANGKVIDLIAVRELLVNMHAWKGLDPKELRKVFQKQLDQFERLSRVRRLQAAGKSYREIAAATGEKYGTIRTWLDGSQLPFWLSERFMVAEFRHRKPVNLQALTNQKDPAVQKALGYIAGTYFGNLYNAQNTSGMAMQLQFSGRSPAIAQELTQAIDLTRGSQTKIKIRVKPTGTTQTFKVASQDLIQQLNQLTEYAEKPAKIQRLLKTPEAELAFLKALMDSHGLVWVNKKNPKKSYIRINFYKKNTLPNTTSRLVHPSIQELTDCTQQLFRKHGITTRFTPTGNGASIYILKRSWKTLHQKIGFNEEKHAKRLAALA